MAAASPAGPPPTTSTSVSRTSLWMASFMALSSGAEVGLGGLGKLGNDVEDVAHDPIVGNLENRGVGVLVDGDDETRRGHAREVLNRTAQAESDVQVGRNGLPRLSHLILVPDPARVDDGAR